MFGSWNKSKIKDNIQIGVPARRHDLRHGRSDLGHRPAQLRLHRRQPRSRLAEVYLRHVAASARFGPVDLGVTAKRTGPRFIFDNNQPVFTGDIGITAPTPDASFDGDLRPDRCRPTGWSTSMPASTWTSLDQELDKTYFQLNVYNLFDKVYVGGFGGGLGQSTSTAAT